MCIRDRSDTLLRVEDLKIYYPVAGSGFGKKEFVKAVDGVTFEVKKGEVFGIVGESGCGKSTLGRGVCKLENLTSGHVYLDGEDITEYNDRRMRSIRKKVQMVFQDPYASLNPRMSVFDIIAEPLLVHHLYQDKADLEKKVLDLLPVSHTQLFCQDNPQYATADYILHSGLTCTAHRS